MNSVFNPLGWRKHGLSLDSLSSPVQSVHPIVIISICGGPRNMTSGVVILEYTLFQPVKLSQLRKHIGVGSEHTRNWDQVSKSKPLESSPTIIHPPNFTVGTMYFGEEFLTRHTPNLDSSIRCRG
ncbi:hypothetical protein TNCV_2474491 [Trichonephila clavipes]|nr:hypothetical protein TNCV_2474491 [Trichonephila clavipes]